MAVQPLLIINGVGEILRLTDLQNLYAQELRIVQKIPASVPAEYRFLRPNNASGLQTIGWLAGLCYTCLNYGTPQLLITIIFDDGTLEMPETLYDITESGDITVMIDALLAQNCTTVTVR